MTGWMVGALLALVVLLAWLSAAGFLRLRTPLDRLHCAAFVNAACGVPLAAAALVGDGLSNRSVKIILVVAVSLLTGAASSHAIGRALRLRGSAPETE